MIGRLATGSVPAVARLSCSHAGCSKQIGAPSRPLRAASAPAAPRSLLLGPKLPLGLPARTQRVPARKPLLTVQASAASAAATSPEPAKSWPGAKPVPLAASLAIGFVLKYLVPCPVGIEPQAWTLLAIFASTIAGLVLAPLPVGAWAFLAVTTAVATKTLSFAAAFSAFNNDVIWLIVVSFFFAKGFEKTGLGERVAQLFVRAFGKSTLGLAYGLNVAEAIIAPAMPSTTARAGGIFMPIIASLSAASGSKPNDPSSRKLGSYLVQAQLQGSVNSSAMFLTAAAQNLLCMKLATEMGVVIASPWMTWFKIAFVPAALGLLVTPLIVYKLSPPEIRDTPDAPNQAAEALAKMGPMARNESIMLGTMVGAVVLWVFGDKLGIPSVVTAMMGLSNLLLTGCLTWRDCLEYPAAWDTLFWFAVLVGMSGQLNSLGVISHFADGVGGQLVAMKLGWRSVYCLLCAVYYGLHYMFASQTAHVGALYSAFLAMMITAGVPGVLAALSLGFLSNLFGSITHYGSGQGAVYFGSGFLSLKEVFSMGALMSVVNLVIWGVVGFMLLWQPMGLF